MTVDDLLKPRYKVIADYPGSGFPIGDLVEPHAVYGFDIFPYPDKYPHLFKSLEWWEDRKPEEMPECLMYDDVTSDKHGVHPVTWEDLHRGYVTADFGTSPIYKNRWRLLTQSEYDSFINSKKP